MQERPLSITEDAGRLVVSGSVDELSVGELRARLTALVEADLSIRVDLSDVDYLPSVGIGVLAKAQAAARRRGQDVVLVAAEGSPAQRVLFVTRLPHLTGEGQD